MTAQGPGRHMGRGDEGTGINPKLCSRQILGNVTIRIMEHTC